MYSGTEANKNKKMVYIPKATRGGKNGTRKSKVVIEEPHVGFENGFNQALSMMNEINTLKKTIDEMKLDMKAIKQENEDLKSEIRDFKDDIIRKQTEINATAQESKSIMEAVSEMIVEFTNNHDEHLDSDDEQHPGFVFPETSKVDGKSSSLNNVDPPTVENNISADVEIKYMIQQLRDKFNNGK